MALKYFKLKDIYKKKIVRNAPSSISGRGSLLFTSRERGENFPFPLVALADNCRHTPPNPVRLAKGSSSNKKSGGGELRGEDSCCC